MTEIMSEIKRDHMLKLIEEGKRLDGRGIEDVRKIQVITDVIESADGSARVKLGKTEVIAGVKIIPGTPFPDTPNIGVLTTGAVSDSLQPHEPQHTRPPCPSPTPGVYPNSCPLSW